MKRHPTSILIGFPKARYHEEWDLISWHMRGVLDDESLDKIVAFAESVEKVAGAAPFNRYTDLSTLTEIHLQVGHIFAVAEKRRVSRRGHPPVKSAFFCDKAVGFGIARMYEALLEGSTIQARAFRDREAAAEWLGVPLEILLED